MLGQAAYEELQHKMTEKALEGEDLAKCKCGNLITVVEGAIDYKVKNDAGKLINKTAAKHMSVNRIRCPECSNNFCRACGEEPYHLGKTCA